MHVQTVLTLTSTEEIDDDDSHQEDGYPYSRIDRLIPIHELENSGHNPKSTDQ